MSLRSTAATERSAHAYTSTGFTDGAEVPTAFYIGARRSGRFTPFVEALGGLAASPASALSFLPKRSELM